MKHLLGFQKVGWVFFYDFFLIHLFLFSLTCDETKRWLVVLVRRNISATTLWKLMEPCADIITSLIPRMDPTWMKLTFVVSWQMSMQLLDGFDPPGNSVEAFMFRMNCSNFAGPLPGHMAPTSDVLLIHRAFGPLTNAKSPNEIPISLSCPLRLIKCMLRHC